ncbi:zincin-like metallopeptidase domain-containing protein [Paracraurococcus lichenis]|uniref:zincin-like metallopeptidase domain-containing protein n=1 Tax=Paracraurococcus lichenis TaxID=3064888 RepID=UPI00351CBE78
MQKYIVLRYALQGQCWGYLACPRYAEPSPTRPVSDLPLSLQFSALRVTVLHAEPAELGAAFALAGLSLAAEPHLDHPQYVAHWLWLLRGDRRAALAAASKA